MSAFEENMIQIYGDLGRSWLKHLPAFLKEMARKYELTELRGVSNLSFNFVASGIKNNESIIFKTGLNTKALAKEARCLALFSEYGGAKLLEYEENIIIMHRAVPGHTLKTYFPSQEEATTNVFCHLVKTLHQVTIPKQHDFYTVEALLETLELDLEIPAPVLSRARGLRDDLLQSTRQTVLLHGDLHHENILKDKGDWLAIDPKGFIGDPIFDICPFLSNPSPELIKQADPILMIEDRIKQCAHYFGYDIKRMEAWHYVHSVLCWAWCLEDNLDPSYFKKLVSYLSELP